MVIVGIDAHKRTPTASRACPSSHIRARVVAALAEPGEVLVSRTVADLFVGSGSGSPPRGSTR